MVVILLLWTTLGPVCMQEVNIEEGKYSAGRGPVHRIRPGHALRASDGVAVLVSWKGNKADAEVATKRTKRADFPVVGSRPLVIGSDGEDAWGAVISTPSASEGGASPPVPRFSGERVSSVSYVPGFQTRISQMKCS